jgi:hypothetical protein
MILLGKTLDYVRICEGVIVKYPTTHELEQAREIVHRQLELMNEKVGLNQTSEDQAGREQQIHRIIAMMEEKKHPACKVWNCHLLRSEDIIRYDLQGDKNN